MYKKIMAASAVLLALSGCVSTETESAAAAAVEAAPTKSTFARFVPERKDDFAWENDLIAFRAYGPANRARPENAGIDCWLKRVDYPIINKWYKQALEQDMSYHKDHGEGLDNYHVGSSAGCGGTSLWLNGERVGLETYTKWEIISATPEKTVFVLHYENEVAGDVYAEEKTISIELGKRLYQVESTFFKNGKPAASLPVTVGLTTHDGKATPKANLKAGWLAAWETLDDSELGTGVKVDPKAIQSYQVIDSNGVLDKGHAVLVLNTDAEGKIAYSAGYGWKKAGAITTPEQWYEYLTNF